jgi:hypothetical protein
MQPLAWHTTAQPCTIAWLTAEWPPPPKPHSRLSETVRMTALTPDGRICTTVATYSYYSHRWLVPLGGTALYWQPRQ